MQLDTSLFLSIYGLSHQYAWLDALGIFFAEYSQYVWALVLLAALFWPIRNRAENRVAIVLAVFAATIARLLVKNAILLFYLRPRPFVALAGVRALVATPLSENLQSFPSGHALFFFAIATVLFCFNKKIGALAFAAALLMGLARVYVGIHWPSDILGGAVLGILTGWLVYRFYTARRTLVDRKVAKLF